MDQESPYVTLIIGLFAAIVLPTILQQIPEGHIDKSIAATFQVVLQAIGALVMWWAVHQGIQFGKQFQATKHIEEREQRRKRLQSMHLNPPRLIVSNTKKHAL